MSVPICYYCKHVKYMSYVNQAIPFCKLTKGIDNLGDVFYTNCKYMNKDFKCQDFKVKCCVKRFYNKAVKDL